MTPLRHRDAARYCIYVSEKVPTFKLSVPLSNLNRFSKFCTAGKHIKSDTKPIRHYPPHLHVATYLGKLKIQFFCRYLADIIIIIIIIHVYLRL